MYNTVKGIYSQYGITASKDSDDWAKQRATLLHEAEKVLMNDLAVIPVVFNQNAVLVSDKLSKTDTTNYYTPTTFTKTKVADFEIYTYYETKKASDGSDRLDENGQPMKEYKTIFDSFPAIEWDKVGQQ
jgi:ABC-type oligopeptide transport system substrate-binding subunit